MIRLLYTIDFIVSLLSTHIDVGLWREHLLGGRGPPQAQGLVQNLNAAVDVLVLSICACVNPFFHDMSPRNVLAPNLRWLYCLLSIVIAIICLVRNLLALYHLIYKGVLVSCAFFAHKGASFLLGGAINKLLLLCHRVH